MSPWIPFIRDSFSHFLGLQDLGGFEYWYFVMCLNCAFSGYVFLGVDNRGKVPFSSHQGSVQSTLLVAVYVDLDRPPGWGCWVWLGRFLNCSYFSCSWPYCLLGNMHFEWGVRFYFSGSSICEDCLEFCTVSSLPFIQLFLYGLMAVLRSGL